MSRSLLVNPFFARNSTQIWEPNNVNDQSYSFIFFGLEVSIALFAQIQLSIEVWVISDDDFLLNLFGDHSLN